MKQGRDNLCQICFNILESSEIENNNPKTKKH